MAYDVKVRDNNGRCLIRFKCPLTGKSISKTFGVFNDEDEKYKAGGVALAIKKALNNGTWSGSIDDYLPVDVKVKIRPLIELLEAKVGDKKSGAEHTVLTMLRKREPITRSADLKRWIEGMTCKNATRNRYRTCVCAVRPDLCEGTKKLKENQSQPDPWEEHERLAICEHFRGTKWEFYVWGLFKTGMRPGEFKGLTPKDFTQNKKGWLAAVTKTVTKDGAKGTTKTGKERLLPMHETDWLTLRAAVTEHGEQWAKVNDENFRSRVWYPALKKLKLKEKVPYTMRHTAISEYLCDGGSAMQASKIFGTSVAMIEKHYAGLVGAYKPV